jgi:hypothetical protein
MYPMSLSEGGHSSAAVSLDALLDGDRPRAADPGHGIRDVARWITIGGWPGLLGADVETAQLLTRGYLDEIRRIDLPRIDGIRRDPENVGRVIRSLARNVSTPVSARAIAADVGGIDGPIEYHSVKEYLDALSRVFVVDDVPAWGPAVRSRSILRKAPVRHFVDPSLAAAALGANPERLLQDVETLGYLFESLVARDLRIYAQAMDATVYHYRDNTGLEADAIVERRDGTWAAFEVKLGLAAVDAAAANLVRLAGRIDTSRHGPPTALGVITGWGPSYRRPDGVAVISIGTLGP